MFLLQLQPHAQYPYADSYFGGLFTPYGPQAIVSFVSLLLLFACHIHAYFCHCTVLEKLIVEVVEVPGYLLRCLFACLVYGVDENDHLVFLRCQHCIDEQIFELLEEAEKRFAVTVPFCCSAFGPGW